MKKSLLSLLCGIVLFSNVAAVMAQSPAGAEPSASARSLEEVVVTARKREESLQNVPVAVAVLSEEQLRNNNVAI